MKMCSNKIINHEDLGTEGAAGVVDVSFS